MFSKTIDALLRRSGFSRESPCGNTGTLFGAEAPPTGARMRRPGLCLIALALAGAANAQTTTRVSVASDGTQGNGASNYNDPPTLSADGRFVAFSSEASNLVANDTNGFKDVFVHDRQTGQTNRVNVASDGAQSADGNSGSPSISADGRYVTFWSFASNLVPGDTNGQTDIFVHDRQTGQTRLVSVASDGTLANGESYGSSLSADGRHVAFESRASNLVPGDTNYYDVFVHDRQTGQTQLVSVASDGTQANGAASFYDPPSISADGRFVAFYSQASNLVPNDTNGQNDIFVHDRQTSQTQRVNVASDGTQANGHTSYWDPPSLSADGRYVAFTSRASNLVPGDTNGSDDIFVHDRQTGQTQRVSVASDGTQGNDGSDAPSLSADGRYVTFGSYSSNLVPGDTNAKRDVFVHDRQTGQTQRVSIASDGMQANDHASLLVHPAISTDGRFVAFNASASNLVPGDTNGAEDVFVHDRGIPFPYATLTVPDSVPSCAAGIAAHPMAVSWVSEGMTFCRASIPNAVSPDVQPDTCLRGGGLPARGSFWNAVRCLNGPCPDPSDPFKLRPTRDAQTVIVCSNLLGQSPPQTSISLELSCTGYNGNQYGSIRTVNIRAPVAGECIAPTYNAPNSMANPQPAWNGGTEFSGTVTNVPEDVELTASLLYEGTRGQTTVWMEGSTLKLLYRDNPGPQPPQITETVTVAISDGVSSTQREYTFTVRSSYVFGSGFEQETAQ